MNLYRSHPSCRYCKNLNKTYVCHAEHGMCNDFSSRWDQWKFLTS